MSALEQHNHAEPPPLTVFAIPKAFERHIGVAQRNAIESWLALSPRPRVILLGDDKGVAEVAREYGVEHIPAIERNAFGTPLLGSVFASAHAAVTEGLMLFVNADILMTSDIMEAIAARPDGDFVIAGRRTCMYLRQRVDFTDKEWEAKLRRLADATGKLWGPTAIDYFVFPCSMFRKVPSFAIGRGWWDHWLISEAEKAGAAVIDATQSVLAIHQNHDFLATEESIHNLALYGRPTDSVSLDRTGYILRDGEVRPRSAGRVLSRAPAPRADFSFADVSAATKSGNRLEWLFTSLSTPLTWLIANHTRLSANQLSLAGLAFGLLGVGLFHFGYELIAGLAFAAFLLLDCTDGAIARLRRSVSDQGGRMDLFCDRSVLLAAGVSRIALAIAATDPAAAIWCAVYLALQHVSDLEWLWAAQRKAVARADPFYPIRHGRVGGNDTPTKAPASNWLRRLGALEAAFRPTPWTCNILFLLGPCIAPDYAAAIYAAAALAMIWMWSFIRMRRLISWLRRAR